MNIRSVAFVFSFLGFIQCGYAQLLRLEVPIRQEVKVGQEIRITLNVEGIRKYHILMEGNPSGAVLERNEFRWTPRNQEEKYYLVRFKLMDSASTLIDKANLALTVVPGDAAPYLVFDRSMPDTIKLVENETFSFTASLKSRQNTDPRSLTAFFTFNENPDIRTFDSCSVSIMGDQLLFRWTPSNKEALQEYLKFRITIIDSDQSISSQALNFKIKNINQAPSFKQQIPDTIYLSPGQDPDIDYAAVDPDNDPLKYDYSPKRPEYTLQGTRIVFLPDNPATFYERSRLPMHITLTVSDGKDLIRRSVTIIRNQAGGISNNPYHQLVIGDFTKKIFSEGDSVLTYLNISNYKNPEQLDIIYTDLNLPPNINSLTKHLVFEKKSSYIKVYSRGVLPYSLVDRDYNYNISVLISDKDPNSAPAFKVLVLTVDDRPDPKNIVQQRDSLIRLINHFLMTANTYETTLEKVRNRINRPWWKKVALITGTLSGVLTLIQSEHSNKTISAISASISLLSIMVTNLPGLSEKTLSEIDKAVNASKARVEQVTEKKSGFDSEWAIDMDQKDFDKRRSEIEDLIDQSALKRSADVCSLLINKRIKTKLDNLIGKDIRKDKNYTDLESIFKCNTELPVIQKPTSKGPGKFLEMFR